MRSRSGFGRPGFCRSTALDPGLSLPLQRFVLGGVQGSWGNQQATGMGFIAKWLSSTLTLALALSAAITAMQAPAVTRDYLAALLQVATDARRDVDQRIASARRHYPIDAESDQEFVAALNAYEPSNAETLALSVGRAAVLQHSYGFISAEPVLLQPVVAASDIADDERGYKRAVLETLLATYVPAINLDLASAAYGVAGLLLGSFVAQLLLALLNVRVSSRATGGSYAAAE
jgi:Protein of unknown function (DUF2937)